MTELNEQTTQKINRIIQNKEQGKETIQEILKIFEEYFNITILYAAEGGSRAYGTHTENSDYDIKFIYMKNIEEYISLNDQLQTISWMDESETYDFIGYDLKKALILCKKSNPTFYEIASSLKTYVYSKFFEKIFFSRPALYTHYRGMLHSQFKKYHQDIMTESHVKKYLHLFRVYLQLDFMLKYNTYPPTSIETILEYVENPQHAEIMEKLIQRKLLNEEELHILNELFSSFLNNQPVNPSFITDDIKSYHKSYDYFNSIFTYFVCEFSPEKIIWR